MSDEPISVMFKKVKDRITDEVTSATNKLQNIQIIDQLAASVQADHPPSPSNRVHFSLTDDNSVINQQSLDVGECESNTDISPQHQLFDEHCIKPLPNNQDSINETNTQPISRLNQNGGILSTSDHTQANDSDHSSHDQAPNKVQSSLIVNSSTNNNRHTLIAMLKESIKLKNSQIKSLKGALENIDKFKGLGDELRKELNDIKIAHEKWTVSIAENKRVVHQELERKNVDIIRLKNEINEYQTKLHDSNTIIRQLKANIQDLGSKMVSTSAAHQKERETLTRDLTIARNNAIRQVQKEHEHIIEKVKLDLEKSIEALKMALLTKDKELMENNHTQQQMAQQNQDLLSKLDLCNDKIRCQSKELEELKQKLEVKGAEEIKQEKEMTSKETMTDEPIEINLEMTKDVESEYLKNVNVS